MSDFGEGYQAPLGTDGARGDGGEGSSAPAAARLPMTPTANRVEQLRRRLEAAPALPVSRRRSEFPGSAPEFAEQAGREQQGGFVEYWRMLRRRKWLLALSVVLGGTAGLLYTLPQTPVYQATTTIEVLDMNPGVVGLKDGGGATGIMTETNLQTQVDILGSATLQDRVVRKLASSEKTIEQPVDRLEKWRVLLNLPRKNAMSKEDILRATAGGISVTPSSASRIIRIDCDSANPKVAADYVNTLAEEFISERMESHWQATQRTSEYLTRQLEELKVRLVESEDELQRYAKSVNLQFTSDQGNQSVSEQKLGQLQTELSTAQEDRIAKQARYELAEKAPVDTLPEVLDDPTLKADHQKLADARREMAELSGTYTADAPAMKKLQNTITATEADMNKIRTRIVDRIHSELVVAQTRENKLSEAVASQSATVSDQASTTIHYNILKKEVDTNREVWESLLQRVKEAGIAAAMRSSNFRVVDAAIPPSVPVKPSLRQGMMSGMVLGLFAGIGLVFLKESMDHSVSLPGETSYYLGSPELAVVPTKSVDGARWKMLTGAGVQEKTIAGRHEAMVERSSFHNADSGVAEAFRVALTSLLFTNRQAGSPKAIAVSSPGPNEGKTTVACNLAISYAEINWRVLLIDGDMRRPRLHSIFGLDNEVGLATLLDRTEPTTPGDLADAVHETSIPNLAVMPRGKLRSTVINLLYSPRFAEILQMVRQEFDIVIIDTPPMLHLPDARAIAHMTDGVVFVVRSGKTLRDTVTTARERFRQDGIPVLGSILNDWNPREIGYYGQANYEDYRRSYEDYRRAYGRGPEDKTPRA